MAVSAMLKDIARLSYFENGPRLAREYLAKSGIRLVVVPHLAKTYLDGGAMLLPDGVAVVGLTLRYDRIDNFWFSLIPRRYWPQLDKGEPPAQEEVLTLANHLKVHPGIIAGRIRYRHGNYRIMPALVGFGEVRRQFPEYTNEPVIC